MTGVLRAVARGDETTVAVVGPYFILHAGNPYAPAILRTMGNKLAADIRDGAMPSSEELDAEMMFRTADRIEAYRARQGKTGVEVQEVDIGPALVNISKHVIASAIRAGYQPDSPLTDFDLTFRLNEPELLASLILIRNHIHGRNRAAGWWNDLRTGEPLQRDPRELAMLIVTELAEAMEGFRKGAMDDHLPHREMFEVELGDAVIRWFDLVGGCGFDISPIVWNKPDLEALQTVPSALLRASGYASNIEATACRMPLLAIPFALAAIHGYDLPGAIIEKLAYNKTRLDHKREARLADGGKKL